MGKTLEDLVMGIEEFQKTRAALGKRTSITLWVPAEYKQRYDALQARTRGGLSKAMREAVVQLIELADKKAG